MPSPTAARLASARIAWWAVLALIPGLSLTGDRLRSALLAHVAPASLEAGLWVLVAGLAVAAAGWHPRAVAPLSPRRLTWLVPALGALLVAAPAAEGVAHIALFGTFGFVSALRFGASRGLALAAAVALLDELLQSLLPFRVGDWRDLGLDLGAALLGAWAARSRFAPACRRAR